MNEERLDRYIVAAMTAALDEAKGALSDGEAPYGAVIIDTEGQIVARARDTVEGNGDPTRHAEVDAVRLAIVKDGPDLSGYILVCTGEPCSMCSSAAWWSGIRGIVFGVSMVELKTRVPKSMSEAIGPVEELNKGLADKFSVTAGVMREEALALWGI